MAHYPALEVPKPPKPDHSVPNPFPLSPPRPPRSLKIPADPPHLPPRTDLDPETGSIPTASTPPHPTQSHDHRLRVGPPQRRPILRLHAAAIPSVGRHPPLQPGNPCSKPGRRQSSKPGQYFPQEAPCTPTLMPASQRMSLEVRPAESGPCVVRDRVPLLFWRLCVFVFVFNGPTKQVYKPIPRRDSLYIVCHETHLLQ